jgi:hypothetical protein
MLTPVHASTLIAALFGTVHLIPVHVSRPSEVVVVTGKVEDTKPASCNHGITDESVAVLFSFTNNRAALQTVIRQKLAWGEAAGGR